MSNLSSQTHRGRLSRSAIVGLAATVMDLASLHVLVSGFGLSPLSANVPSLLLGLAVQFVGNKYFAFQDHSRRLLQQGSYFVLVELGALALNAGIFHVSVEHVGGHHIVVRVVCSALIYFAYSYPLWRLIFKSTQSVQHVPQSTEK